MEERKGGEGGLVALAVGEGCEGAGEEGGEGEAAEGDPQLGDGGAFEVEGADDLVEVARRDEVGDGLRPLGHGGDGGEQSAHELEDHDAGKHDEDALEHALRAVGDGNGEAQHEEAENDGGGVDCGDAAEGCEAVDEVADEHR